MRHSTESLLINHGEDYLVVKERLGHASITTTIDTYSHLYPSKQKTLANKLDDLFKMEKIGNSTKTEKKKLRNRFIYDPTPE